MDYDPAKYNQMANDVIGPARKLIEMLEVRLRSLGKSCSDPLTILDLGCGPGNSVRFLYKTFPAANFIGVDVDPKMIETATQLAGSKQFKFYAQDIAAPWSSWHAELQALAGRVDVIHSNYALHWIRDVDSLALNCWNLLAPASGLLLSNLLYVGDLATVCETEQQKADLRAACHYPTERKFVDDFVFAFRDAGFRHFELTYEEPQCWYELDFYCNDFIKIPLNYYRGYMTPEHRNDPQLEDEIKRLYLKLRILRTDQSGPELRCEIVQKLWTVCLHKTNGGV